MKAVSTLFAALIASAAAAPAIIWSGDSKAQAHSSELTSLKSLVGESSSVIFVVERDENGSEGLTTLTSSGSLPKLSSKYSEATSVHHSVRGIETFDTVAKELGASTVTLEDYLSETGSSKASINKDGKISGKTVIVKVSNESKAADIDSIVSAAIENTNVKSVVLTSVRGLSEVKFERELKMKQQLMEGKARTSRRRLEDQNGDDGGSSDAIYFVNFTPNIFSGVLFFFFFAAVTYTGIGCMGMIAGQEVYVTKYPSIGREA
jgi:hypothetical protein